VREDELEHLARARARNNNGNGNVNSFGVARPRPRDGVLMRAMMRVLGAWLAEELEVSAG
jgi:hypothetical protein